MGNCNISYSPKQPRDYRVVSDGYAHVFHRPNGTEVWGFDSSMVWDYEVALVALEDHSEQLLA